MEKGAGVDKAFDIFAAEIRRDMMLAGCPTIDDIGPETWCARPGDTGAGCAWAKCKPGSDYMSRPCEIALRSRRAALHY